MKLQVAIDRMPFKQAVQLAKSLDGVVDVIEIGTSIVKDYGLEMLKKESFSLEQSELLIDLKVIDEGEYEFNRGFETSADILTVMGSASQGTLAETYRIAQSVNKGIFIDLMEVPNCRVEHMLALDDAIFGLHHSKDSQESFNAVDQITQFHEQFPSIQHLAVAGGIDIEQAKLIAQQDIVDVIIVGGKITGASNPVEAAKNFMNVIK